MIFTIENIDFIYKAFKIRIGIKVRKENVSIDAPHVQALALLCVLQLSPLHLQSAEIFPLRQVEGPDSMLQPRYVSPL